MKNEMTNDSFLRFELKGSEVGNEHVNFKKVFVRVGKRYKA
jgi:hypothetical protein